MIIKQYLLLMIILMAACQKAETEKCNKLQSLYSFSEFPIGVAIDMEELDTANQYYKIAVNQFNSITPENIFKPSFLHPTENYYDWDQADILVDFCQTNNKRLHGHTLLWHKQLPEWMKNYQGTPDDWENMFKNHIQTICQHFKGKVTSWDVVNEAFNDDGTLRTSIWKQNIGPDYIEKAFRYAHEADPDALLFYNDYDIALNETKRKAILSLLNNLRQRGVPIHGIGMQMHISIVHPVNSQIAAALKEVAANDYKIHLSEIDIAVNPFSREIQPSSDLLERQANKLAAITHYYKEIPAKNRYGMTFWGVSDKDTWIRKHFQRDDFPLLFDDNYQPKPVYCKFKESL